MFTFLRFGMTVGARQTAKHVIVVAIDGFELHEYEMKGKTWNMFRQNGTYTLSAHRSSWQGVFGDIFEVKVCCHVIALDNANACDRRGLLN